MWGYAARVALRYSKDTFFCVLLVCLIVRACLIHNKNTHDNAQTYTMVLHTHKRLYNTACVDSALHYQCDRQRHLSQVNLTMRSNDDQGFIVVHVINCMLHAVAAHAPCEFHTAVLDPRARVPFDTPRRALDSPLRALASPYKQRDAPSLKYALGDARNICVPRVTPREAHHRRAMKIADEERSKRLARAREDRCDRSRSAREARRATADRRAEARDAIPSRRTQFRVSRKRKRDADRALESLANDVLTLIGSDLAPASEQADLASSLEPLDAKTNMHVLRAKAAVRLEEVEIERACPKPTYAIFMRNYFAHKDSSSHE